MDKLELFEITPAEKFWDMHFLGNGRLGISVKGEPYFETIAINDNTLWSGSEHFTKNPQHFEAMKSVQQLIKEGNLKVCVQEEAFVFLLGGVGESSRGYRFIHKEAEFAK